MARTLPNLPPMNPPEELGRIRADWTNRARKEGLVWTWEGPDTVMLDREFLLESDGVTILGGNLVKVGPYTLELLGLSWAADGYVAVRKP